MLINDTTNSKYPKTLLIRNTEGGMIWQIYHVRELYEADRISSNATKRGFLSCTLEDHHPDQDETFPKWREESKWLKENREKKDH